MRKVHLIFGLLLLSYTDSILADRVCVGIVAKVSGNSTPRLRRRDMGENTSCPRGYIEIINTSEITGAVGPQGEKGDKGDQGDPGEQANSKVFTAVVNEDGTLRRSSGVVSVRTQSNGVIVTFSQNVAACSSVVTQTGDEIGTINLSQAPVRFFATQHPDHPFDIAISAFTLDDDQDPVLRSFNLVVACP